MKQKWNWVDWVGLLGVALIVAVFVLVVRHKVLLNEALK